VTEASRWLAYKTWSVHVVCLGPYCCGATYFLHFVA